MTDLACACGYEADTPQDLRDHLGEAFIPADDTAPDGQVHAERARGDNFADPVTLGCTCGYTTDDTAAMDEHLLRVFVSGDGVGLDGMKHVVDGAA